MAPLPSNSTIIHLLSMTFPTSKREFGGLLILVLEVVLFLEETRSVIIVYTRVYINKRNIEIFVLPIPKKTFISDKNATSISIDVLTA
jgi:hypothetical protein